jgi:hypothetical protein
MYTIKFNGNNRSYYSLKVLAYLQERMAKEGRFKATLTPSFVWARGVQYPTIKIKPVRLVKAKPYCGNHPGECPVSDKPKPKSHHLEWNDWVKFHDLVNRCLNRFHVDADVWSNPADVRGKMWIRKGKKARVKWDWTEKYLPNPFNFPQELVRPIRVWNQGTPDQFIK